MIKTNDARFLTRLLGAVLLSITLVACSSDDSPGDSGGTDSGAQTDSGGDSALQTDEDTRSETDSVDEADADAVSDADSEADAQTDDDAQSDAADEADAGPNCLADGHAAGERYPAGDECNFCTCNDDGSETCTVRTCQKSLDGCDYNGAWHEYGERFAATDGCNACVCAATGLACTRRDCTDTDTAEEVPVLLESLKDACGDDPEFTGQAVLDAMPHHEVIDESFAYDRDRTRDPETLDDTTITVRTAYDDGFIVCRESSPGDFTMDMQMVVEWITADGAFNEGFPAYMRRSNFGFLDAWVVGGMIPYAGLHGTYTPNCAIDPGDYIFNMVFFADGGVYGDLLRACQTDMALEVGKYGEYAP